MIKDNEGNIVKQGNIIGKNDFTVSGLSSGFYSLTIINPEGQTSLSSSATVKFVVYTDVNAKISADNRIYGQPTTFNMTRDVDGIYIIDIVGYGKIQINVINGTGTKQAYLPAGEYRTVTSAECGYYRLDCKEASFEVEPSEISIYFEELYDVVYPNNIHGYILTDISGDYELTIGTKTQKIYLDEEFFYIIDESLDAVTYNIIVKSLCGEDYYPTVATAVVHVLKQNVTLSLSLLDGDFGSPTMVMAHSSVDGEYTIRIGEIEKSVNLTNNFGVVDFGILDVGTYNASITYAGDRNHNSASNETTFTISQSDYSFKLYVSDDKFIYGDEVEIKHNLPDSAEGYILYSLADGTFLANLTVGETLKISTLNAGENYITGVYSGDSNLKSSSCILNLTIDKAPNNVVVDVANVTYGNSSIINVTADVDGDYIVNINGKETVVNVRDGVGNSPVDLNAGEYTTSTRFDNGNYDTEISESVFKVYNAINNVIVNVEDVIYGEQSLIIIIADADGNYIVNINGKRVTVNVAGGKGNASVALDANNYTTSTTFSCEDYDTIITEAEFEVKKAVNNVSVFVGDVDYGEAASINIIADVDGDYTVNVGSKSLVVTVENGKGSNSISLDPGSYETQISFSNSNYVSNYNEATFNVFKAKVSLMITVSACTYPNEVSGAVFATVDGDYTITIGNYTEIVSVKNGAGNFNAGIFDAGTYIATVSFEGDDTYDAIENMTSFEVKKQKISFNIIVNDSDIYYGESVKLTPIFEGDANGTIKYSLNEGTLIDELPVSESLILPHLDAGFYLIWADYSGNENCESLTTILMIRVNQLPNEAHISVENVSYGTSAVIKISADVDGNYTVNINGTTINVNVLNGQGNASILLDAGMYSTITDFNNRNYVTVFYDSNFEVKKADVNLRVVIEDKVYSEEIGGTVYADVDGEYTLTVGSIETVVNVENGIGEFNLGILDADTYEATISYIGDNNYNLTSNTTRFTVNKADTELAVFVADAIYPNEVTGAIITNCNDDIEVYINGTFFEKIGIGDLASFSLGKLDVGEYNITVKFDGNKNFNGASNSSKFNVAEGNLTFVIDTNVSSFDYGDSIVINHTINDDATGTIKYYLSDGTLLGEADVRENFTLPRLDSGEYLIIANYTGDHNYLSAVSMLKIKINTPTGNVVVSVEDVSYGTPSVINIVAEVDGTYTVKINGKTVTVNVFNGVGSNSISLDAGSYSTETSFLGNYDLNVTEADFEVKKAEMSLNISVANVTYLENVEYVVYASVDGMYNVTVGSASMTVNVINGICKFDVGVLDAGDYNATVRFSGSKNYNNNTNATNFTVEKADIFLLISVLNYTYPDDIEVYVHSNYDGEYEVDLGVCNTTVVVAGGFGSTNIGKLNAGDYTAVITFDGDKNTKNQTVLTEFLVSKALPEFKIAVNDTEFDYRDIISITHTLPEDATGTITYFLTDTTELGRLTVSSNFTLPRLDIGEYSIVAIYSGDANYEANLDYADFVIKGALNNVAVSVENVTYGEESVIELSADVNGLYHIDINGTIYNVTVENNIGSISIALDAGEYYANVSSANDNYNIKSQNATFEVKKAVNEVVILADDVDYGEVSLFLIAADVDATYTLDIGRTVIDIVVENKIGYASLYLDAGSYSTKTTFIHDNYETIVNEVGFIVNKIDNDFRILVNDIVLGSSSIINLISNIDGIYEISINDTVGNITVKNGVGSYDAGILDSGVYDLNIKSIGNNNVNPWSGTATFTVFVAENYVVVSVDDVSYGEDAVIVVSADVDGTYVVDVNGTNVTVEVIGGKGNTSLSLPAGSYYANATFDNGEYLSIITNATFKVLGENKKTAKDLQDLIDNAVEGSVVDLGNFEYENVSNINITKDITLKGEVQPLLELVMAALYSTSFLNLRMGLMR